MWSLNVEQLVDCGHLFAMHAHTHLYKPKT